MTLRLIAFVIMALAVGGIALAQQPPAAVNVGTVIAKRQAVTAASRFVGRVEARERVEIRARVTGYLEAVLFTEGDTVKDGDPLYRIEQPPFQAAAQQAQGDLYRAQAKLANATYQRQRAEELVKTSAGTQATLDQRTADEKSAQGDVINLDAAMKVANINLGYATITSPITGRIGMTKVTRGNVVGPDSGVLALIVSQDPMWVVFPVSQREFIRIQKAKQQRSYQQITVREEETDTGGDLRVRLLFADGTPYPETGKIDFIGVTVQRDTDTVLLRAVVANPDDTLTDGQLLTVLLESEHPDMKIVVPQAALLADQQGSYVFVVEDGKAVIRRLTTGGEQGADAVVQQGLNGGEQVIVEGLQSVRPGGAVLASPLPVTQS